METSGDMLDKNATLMLIKNEQEFHVDPTCNKMGIEIVEGKMI